MYADHFQDCLHKHRKVRTQLVLLKAPERSQICFHRYEEQWKSEKSLQFHFRQCPKPEQCLHMFRSDPDFLWILSDQKCWSSYALFQSAGILLPEAWYYSLSKNSVQLWHIPHRSAFLHLPYVWYFPLRSPGSQIPDRYHGFFRSHGHALHLRKKSQIPEAHLPHCHRKILQVFLHFRLRKDFSVQIRLPPFLNEDKGMGSTVCS